MANFNVHISVAAGASSVAGLLAVNMNLVSVKGAPWLVFLGIVGGMLPDIDATNSKPVRLLFNVLALLSVSSVLKALRPFFDNYQLLGIAILIYYITRYLVLMLISKFTVHRGIFHSILACVFFSLLITNVSYYFLAQKAQLAWLNGFFLGFGFLIHLLLDEMYSVDLSNRRIKKSFGTALKLFNYKNLTSSTFMGILTIFLYAQTPQLTLNLSTQINKLLQKTLNVHF